MTLLNKGRKAIEDIVVGDYVWAWDEETGEKSYITKGDKNTYIDVYPVSYDQVAGKYCYSVPFGQIIGQAIAALTDQRVYFVFIMLPLMICFLSYMWQIITLLTAKE